MTSKSQTICRSAPQSLILSSRQLGAPIDFTLLRELLPSCRVVHQMPVRILGEGRPEFSLCAVLNTKKEAKTESSNREGRSPGRDAVAAPATEELGRRRWRLARHHQSKLRCTTSSYFRLSDLTISRGAGIPVRAARRTPNCVAYYKIVRRPGFTICKVGRGGLAVHEGTNEGDATAS